MKPRRLLQLFPLALVPLFLAAAASGQDWTPLFNGSSTEGWVKPYDWGEVKVENGEIHLSGEKKFFLVTEETFGDFELEAEVKVPVGGNSGIQFRCHYKQNRLWGYQAEVDTSDRSWSGGIYDEGRRAWLAPPEGEAKNALNVGEWNRYRIRCVGDHLQVWVNGIQTADVRDPVDVNGHIALQHHGEAQLTYRFREVRIKPLGQHEWKPIWSGRSLKGWTPWGNGSWEAINGAIVGSHDGSGEAQGLLWFQKPYDNFTVRFDFKSVKGDSGFYFRSIENDNPNTGITGMQAEVDPGRDANGNYEAGGLYETHGRGWVRKPDPEAMKKAEFKPGEWQKMAISAHGGRIVVHLNDIKVVEVMDDPGLKEGRFALQLHAGQEMHVEFRGLAVLEGAARIRVIR